MRFSAAVRERVLSMYLARETETMMPNNNKTPRRRRRSSRVPCRLRGGGKKRTLADSLVHEDVRTLAEWRARANERDMKKRNVKD